MQITYTEYTSQHEKALRDFSVILQDHIVSLDTFDRVVRSENYATYFTKKLLDQIETSGGKIFVACDGEVVVGMIAAAIKPRSPEDDHEIKKQKYGEIAMLLVLEEYRSQGIGQQLFEKAEAYLLKDEGCDFVEIVVFGDNKKALAMYQSNGYREREVVLLKKAPHAEPFLPSSTVN